MNRMVVDVRMMFSSGIGTYIRNIVPAVISACPNVEFYLLGSKRELEKFEWAKRSGTTVIDCTAPIYSITEQLDFLKKIPANSSVVWIPHYNIPFFGSRKLIVTVHDLFHLAMPAYIGGLHKRLYARLMFNAVARNADIIICVSQFTANELFRLTDTDQKKVRVIHHGVAASCPSDQSEGNPHSKPYLLFVGNVKPNKNLIRLLEAFKTVCSAIPHDLVIVGKKEGFITSEANVMAKANELGSRVRFTGAVNNSALQRFYRHATAFVFPSLYEGFGFPPLEAMTYGCPVISSHAASLKEICGAAAYYIDPYNVENIANAIVQVLGNESLRQALINKGYERAKMYTWERSAHQHISVFEEMLQK